VKQTLDSIFEYAKDIGSVSVGEIRSIALDVMLQIAVVCGSVPLCISVASDLFKGDEALPDNPEIQCNQTLADLNSIEYDYSIEFSKANELDSFEARIFKLKDVQKSQIFNCPSCSTVAADATSLYTWDCFSMTLDRLGSGYNSTIT
jgi:hypothetical protein